MRISDIFEGGEFSGGIVVRRESVTDLVLAIGRLLDDKDWSRELGKRARRRVEKHFSLDVVGQQLRRFLLNEGSESKGPDAEESHFGRSA